MADEPQIIAGTASQFRLEDLVGRRVVSRQDFSGVPKGTVGVVDEHYGKPGAHEGIMVRWITTSGREVRDGFGRDDEFDETAFLDVVP